MHAPRVAVREPTAFGPGPPRRRGKSRLPAFDLVTRRRDRGTNDCVDAPRRFTRFADEPMVARHTYLTGRKEAPTCPGTSVPSPLLLAAAAARHPGSGETRSPMRDAGSLAGGLAELSLRARAFGAAKLRHRHRHRERSSGAVQRPTRSRTGIARSGGTFASFASHRAKGPAAGHVARPRQLG
jgi:hypothetical protein